MNFVKALELLKEGNRIITEKEIKIHDQGWFHMNLFGQIDYMNEVWKPSVEWLQECVEADDWVNVETHCNYHDHDESGNCYNNPPGVTHAKDN